MARGNRRWGRTLSIVLLIVVAVLVIADRVGVVIAEDAIAKQARTQLASENVTTSGNPTVTIDGFPFLTQVLAGHYDKINIVLPQPTSMGVRFDSVNVTATGVSAPLSTVASGNGTVEAFRVVGTAKIDWQSFEELIDLSALKQYGVDPSMLTISSTNAGAITISAPITLLGQSFTAVATGTMTVADDLLHVRITKIGTDGPALAPAVETQLQSLISQLTFDARIPELPYHLALDSVSADAQGVNISASANDVTLGS